MPPEGLSLPDAGRFAARLGDDPLLAYALLAAAILAVASLAGGLARGDARTLRRPEPWAAAALAALAGLALVVAGDAAAGTAAEPFLAGLRRLPLWFVALGYGPATGVLAAALFAAAERTQGAVPAAELVLILEMAVVGWLAIAPSPRRSRLAAPFDALLGWGLAAATAGLAVLAWTHRPLPPEVVLEAVRHDLPGVVAAGVLLVLPSARWWRRAAPGTALATPEGGNAPDADGLAVPPLRRERRRRRGRAVAARLPRGLRRARRRRRSLAAPAVPAGPMTPADPAASTPARSDAPLEAGAPDGARGEADEE